MGQQQLLLIVLGVIIVGVAVVAGMGMFNAGAEEAMKDEIVSQCMNIGANAQQYYKKPKAMGGGGGSFVGYSIPARMTATANAGVIGDDGIPTTAGYTASAGTGTGITITGTPNNSDDYPWTVTCTVDPVKVVTTITEE